MLIDFSNIKTYNGKTISSGTSSGLDTAAIMESLVNIKKLPITKLEDNIKLNQSKLSAFSEMRSLLTAFKTASDALRNPPGFNNASSNAFKTRQVFLSSNTAIPANTYIGVTAKSGAKVDNYTLTINHIAQAKTERSQSFTSKTASATEAAAGITSGMFSAGTFQINGKDITIAEGDSLIEIESAINAVSSQSKVSASIIQVADNDFRLSLKSTETGVANAYTITDNDGVLSEVTFSTTQIAEDAEITFNGITITRSSNTISDVVDNITFSLFQETPVGTTLKAEIDENTSSVKESIATFVGAYNDLVTFASKQQEKDPETGLFVESAYLAKDSSLKSNINDVFNELSRAVSGLVSGAKSTLADIGITFQDYAGDDETPATKNILSLDETTLDAALSSDFEGVRKIFEFDFNPSSNKIAAYTRTNSLSVTSFSVDIDNTRTSGDQVRITYNDGSGNVTINADYSETPGAGGTIVGQEGTVLEGLTLLYSGTGIDTVDVNLSQGIGDRLFNILENYLSEDGLLTSSENTLLEANTKKNEEITNLNSKLEEYRERLLAQYAAVEEAITRANSILQLLDAQAAALESK